MTGLLPVPDRAETFVDLVRPGGREPIARQKIKVSSESPRTMITFSLDQWPLGPYEVRALLQKPDGRSVERREASVIAGREHIVEQKPYTDTTIRRAK